MTVEIFHGRHARDAGREIQQQMQLKGSEYKAKVNFSMAGGWSIAVKITRGDKTVQAKFSVDVR